jgi:hypothetical protein
MSEDEIEQLFGDEGSDGENENETEADTGMLGNAFDALAAIAGTSNRFSALSD